MPFQDGFAENEGKDLHLFLDHRENQVGAAFLHPEDWFLAHKEVGDAQHGLFMFKGELDYYRVKIK